MTAFFSRDTLAELKPREEDISLDYFGGKRVKMKALTSAQVVEYSKVGRARDTDDTGVPITCAYVAAHLCDEHGLPLFHDLNDGVDVVAALPNEVMLELSTVAIRLTPLNRKQIEDRAKNSQGPTPSES